MAPRKPVDRFSLTGYRAWGSMRALWASHHIGTKVAGGTYDAGKTYGCVGLMDAIAKSYPGARMTFVHRSLNRVYRNIIPSYEKFIGYKPPPRDENPEGKFVTRFGGERPEFFEYRNGTRIYMNGLDKPQNLLSDFFDAAYINQAELLPFATWDELTARVSERAGTLPISYLIGDCNPAAPHHWIREQTKAGKLKYYKMSFLDNPEIIEQGSDRLAAFKIDFANNPSKQKLAQIADLLTPGGKRRVDKLKNLDGLRFKRGFLGVWASGEGLVFEDFEPETHIVDVSIMPPWRRYMSIDWGFRNPASVLWWALDPDDRLYAYKEIYQTGLTKPELIRMIQANTDSYDRIIFVVPDSADADGVEQLRRAGFRVKIPKKDRVAQIDAIKARLKKDVSGQPAIFFLRDRLVHAPDADLKADYRPVEVTDEFLSLSYSETRKGTSKDDESVVGDNHGIDSTSYLLTSLQSKTNRLGSGRIIDGSVKLK